jgi:hypothetical protein
MQWPVCFYCAAFPVKTVHPFSQQLVVAPKLVRFERKGIYFACGKIDGLAMIEKLAMTKQSRASIARTKSEIDWLMFVSCRSQGRGTP